MINDPKKILELVRQGKLVEASFLYDGSFTKFEQDTSYLKFGVQLFFELGRRERCLDLLDRMSRLSPIEPEAALFVLKSYEQLNATAELASTADFFSKTFSQNIHFLSEYARILQTMGDFEKSSRIFEKILKQFGDDAQIYRMHMISVHGSDLKYSAIKNMEKLWKKTSLSIIDRINLGFALGKVFDDRGDYQKAVHFFKIANDAQAEQYPYDFDERVSEAKMFLEAQKEVPKLQASSPAEFTPIFITGMPRSGTTLIETKLLQSGGFETVGESSIAHRAAYKFFGKGKELIGIKDASPERIKDFGNYCNFQMRLRAQKFSPAILDKSMRNFLVAGYLISGLPGARIFFINRNPLDIAQSLYRNYFKLGSHRYSNRTENIAKEIALYDAVTERFFKAYEGDISQVSYENFVTDPSGSVSDIKDWIGINDKAKNLETEIEKKSIKTLSMYQARQPVHTGRISAWRRYQEIFTNFPEAYETARSGIEEKLKLS